jgi:hydrogenase expression/formation protein HypC
MVVVQIWPKCRVTLRYPDLQTFYEIKILVKNQEQTTMCLAIPAQIMTIDNNSNTATVSVDKVKVDISLALVDDVNIGDYVLVHVGYALNKIDEDEALKTLALFAEAGLSQT